MWISASAADLLWPVAFAAFVWWFATGIVLLLDGLPTRTFRWSLAISTLLAGVGLAGLIKSAAVDGVMASYVAFASAVLVWGWHELAFLTGLITGPRKAGCSEDCGSWAHFRHAIEAILYHELALIGTALLIVALTWQQPNQVGTWTFLALWLMRTSAKLNLFLGVRNLSEEFLPEHLAYLKSFFRRRPMNWLFPLSVTGGTVLAGLPRACGAGPCGRARGAAGRRRSGAVPCPRRRPPWWRRRCANRCANSPEAPAPDPPRPRPPTPIHPPSRPAPKAPR